LLGATFGSGVALGVHLKNIQLEERKREPTNGRRSTVLEDDGAARGTIDSLFAAWARGFVTVVESRRRSDQLDEPVHGRLSRIESDFPDAATWTRIDSHVPVDGDTTLQQAALDANNGTDFLHVATYYRDGSPIYSLHHRLAHPDDLGAENDGTYHQLQVREAAHLKVEANGTLLDYLWKEGMKAELATARYYDAGVFDKGSATVATKFLRDSDSEANCMDLFLERHDGESKLSKDFSTLGVLAFGSGGQPFNYNGSAAGWISECGFGSIE